MSIQTTLPQAFPDSLPPCSIEAEEAVLGGILLQGEIFCVVRDILRPEHFYSSSYQKIFAAMEALDKEGEPIDLMTVMERLSRRRQLDVIGGHSTLVLLLDRTVSAVNIDNYAKLVREKFARRQLIEFGQRIESMGRDTGLKLDAIGGRLESTLEHILKPHIPDPVEREYQKYKKLLDEVSCLELSPGDPGFKAYQFQSLAARVGKSVGQLKDLFYKSLLAEENEPVCSLAELREKYGGEVREWLLHGLFPAGNITLLHSLGGVGKTRLAYDLAYHFCEGIDWNGFTMNGGGPVMLVQTDEQPVDILDNLDNRGFKDHHPLVIKSRWHVDFLANLYKDIEKARPKLVLIDSLASISAGTVSENDTEFARPILLLNKIARDFGCHILLLHHSSKARDASGKGQARGTTAIYNAVSQVWQLTRVDATRSPDDPERLLLIEKSRCRRPATYQLVHNPLDRSWTCLGETREDESTRPVKQRILDFLKEHRGIRYQNREICDAVGGTEDNIRRLTGQLANDGLINSTKSKHSKAKVYWLGSVNCNKTVTRLSDPTDPPDREDRLRIDPSQTTAECEIEGVSIHPSEISPEKSDQISPENREERIDRAIAEPETPSESDSQLSIHLSDPPAIAQRSTSPGSDRTVPVEAHREKTGTSGENCENLREECSQLIKRLQLTREEILQDVRGYECESFSELSCEQLEDYAATLSISVDKIDESPGAQLKIGDRVQYTGGKPNRISAFRQASERKYPARIVAFLDDETVELESRAWVVRVSVALSQIEKEG